MEEFEVKELFNRINRGPANLIKCFSWRVRKNHRVKVPKSELSTREEKKQ